MLQYHLKGKGFSGRAVRVRELESDEISDNLAAAAKLVGGEATFLELKKREHQIAAKRMLVAFTEPCDDPFADGVKWKKVTPDVLEEFGKYFRAKDMAYLEQVYRENHEITPGEVAEISGKAVPVASED